VSGTGYHPLSVGRCASAVLAAVVLSLVALAPAADARPVPSSATGAEGRGPATAQVGPFTFGTGPYRLRQLPIERLPYNGSSIVASCGLTDSLGVAMFRASDGLIHNHPVAQTRCALNMQRNYRLTGDRAYLETSIANATRLLDRAVTHRGGMFFPYPFSWTNPGRGRMVPPWYSAMAQGQALSVFTRLYEWTGNASWLDAAHRTFASFKVPRQDGGPWVVGVENGLLWLDEYPTTPIDRVFNGHNFSMYGLYDYWRVTGNADAERLALGAIHSSYVAATSRVRVPGGISRYCSSDACLANEVKNPAYHRTHISQLRNLHWLTGHWHFASLAESFMADAPYASSGRVAFAAGRHDGYRFSADGIGVFDRSVVLTATQAFRYSMRDVPGGRWRPNNGIWLHVTEGPLQGLWIRESARAVPLGFVDRIDFWTPRTVRVAAGRYTGRVFDSAGGETSATTVTTGGTDWTYTEVARINGTPSVLLASGPIEGRWLALDARTLRDTSVFDDVDASMFRTDIIWLTEQGITRGCRPWSFCPDAPVTREQMASFLVRALRLPATSRDAFADDDASAHESDINRLAAAGLTGGCAADRFCPRSGVTREQMASFLVRALRLPPTSLDAFADDDASPHESDINRLAAAGLTGGCAARRFCPRAGITRGQMAAFLHRALGPTAAVRVASQAPRDATPSEPTPSPSPSPSPAADATPGPSSSEPPPDSSPPAQSPTPSATVTPPPSATPTEAPTATAGVSDAPAPTPPMPTPSPP
jgi:hypothetical protein